MDSAKLASDTLHYPLTVGRAAYVSAFENGATAGADDLPGDSLACLVVDVGNGYHCTFASE